MLVGIKRDANRCRILYFFGLKLNISLKRKKQLKLRRLIQEETKIFLGAMADPNGLGFLELMLTHANVSQKHKYIFQQMPENAICIDAGANIGVFSDICLNRQAKVYSFEPNQIAFDILRRKYRNNHDIYLYKKAVWVEETTLDFFSTELQKDNFLLYSQGNSLIKNHGEDGYSHTTKETVEACDFNQFIIDTFVSHNKHIYLLKMDIEGAEFEVLNKLIDKDLHKNFEFILVETHERFFDDGDCKIKELQKKIKEKNINNIFLDWV